MKKNLLLLLFILTATLGSSQQTTIKWSNPKPADDTYIHNTKNLTIQLRVTNPPPNAKFDVQLNGRSIYKNTKSETVPLINGHFVEDIHIPDNSLQSIVLTIKDKEGNIQRSEPLFVSRGETPPPILYLLAFGPEPPDIDYTDNDAIDFERAFSRQACGTSGIYADVISKKIVVEEATAAGMLTEMRKMVRRHAIKPNDVFILFVSSHGEHRREEFYIHGHKYSKLSPEETTVSSSKLFDIFNPVHAKKIFFIDACNSGRDQSIDQSSSSPEKKHKTGYTIIASSDFNSNSYHHPDWKNGAFTEVLLGGLSGKANKKDTLGKVDDIITVTEIFEYVKKGVPVLCDKTIIDYDQMEQQIPEIYMDELGDFPLFKYDKFCAPVIGGEEVFYDTAKLLPGEVTIGSPKREKGHQQDEKERPVAIKSSTALGKYEVTNKEYCEFLNDPTTDHNKLREWIKLKSRHCKITRRGTTFKTKHPRKPVVMVSWYGANAFATWLSGKDCIYDYDLPTADEWEYAARQGTYKTYGFTNIYKELGQRKDIADVGSYDPDPITDIYDMATNVSEWCKNTYRRKGEIQGAKEARGGSFTYSERQARIAARHKIYPEVKSPNIGFRLIRRPKKDKDCE